MATRCLALAILVVAGTLVLGNLAGTSAQCHVNIPSILSECSRFVQKSGPKVHPSPPCCEVLKGADVPCVCKKITKEIESKVSMEKAIYVARTCGLTVPAGMRCGSYTVPPKA